MRKSTLNQLLAQFRAEVAAMTTVEKFYATVRMVAFEANRWLGDPPAFGVLDKSVLVPLYRTNTTELAIVDFYRLREDGRLEGYRVMSGSAVEHNQGEVHPITSEEFLGAFVQRIEVKYHRLQSSTEAQRAFCQRICKPIIEICSGPNDNGLFRATLAANRKIWKAGYKGPYEAADALLGRLSSSRDEYTIILV